MDDCNNFVCGGDLEANPVSLCQMPRTKEKMEKHRGAEHGLKRHFGGTVCQDRQGY